ncbi:MAG TPA: hypothetical protein VLC91_11920, partial [Spongiibacteraceae bacterium]|nr:hypothetical protein [Spongiibacteraceae bacterium]
MQVDSADAKHFNRLFNVSTVLLLFTAVAIFIWEMRSPILQMDDAFISYRYAQNWVAGHGLVFNVGERVEGYTNFLWVLLIALGMKLGFSAPIFGHWLCVVTGALLLFANYLYCAVLLPRSARLLAALAPLLLLSLNTFVLWTSSGLEQGFFAALVVLALWASTVGRHWTACGFCCLATLTRPEGVLVAALLLNMPWLRAALRSSTYKWRETFTALLPALCFGIFVGLFTLFRWFYYGDVVPNTFYAKVGGIPFWWGTFYLQQFALDGPVFLLFGT